MNKKILYILLGAILVFGLLFLLWSWLFSGGTAGQNNGQFGTASSTGQNFDGSTGAGNGQTSLGGNTANGTITVGNNGQNTGAGTGLGTNGGTTGSGSNGTGTNGNGINGSGSNGTGSTGGGSNGTGSTGYGTNNGITTTYTTSTGSTTFNIGTISTTTILVSTTTPWLGGNGGGSGQTLTLTEINSISGNVSGSAPTITNTSGGSGGTSLVESLAGAAVAGAVSCGVRATAIASAATAGSSAALGVQGANAASVPISNKGLDSILAYNAASQPVLQNGSQATSFAGCVVNVLAKAALSQITVSVVNWINSGFNGQPSFVSNYNQFFTNVADAATGQFIQGSALSFLCSPFKLQIKIAVAQSYANRNTAASCTLTSIIKNVDSFMNGNFAQGGWAGLLSVTTVPTNNAFGAFAYAQIGVANAQSTALANAKNNISPTGFLNLQQLYGCTDSTQNGISGSASIGTNPQAAAAGGAAALPPGCHTKVVTPGGAIAATLDSTLKQGSDQLGLGNDLDQIFNALTTQLLTKSLYNGVSSLSGQNTTEDTASEQKDAALITDMETNIGYAQQYGAVEQGSIGDIQNAQQNLNNLFNCWTNAASSTGLTSTQIANAQQYALEASSSIAVLNPRIDAYNTNITNANSVIATLQQFVSQATQVTSAAAVQTLSDQYAAAEPFITQTDVSTEQQNRTTLQSEMSGLNAQTKTGLNECQNYR